MEYKEEQDVGEIDQCTPFGRRNAVYCIANL